jgi:hypothetical protein
MTAFYNIQKLFADILRGTFVELFTLNCVVTGVKQVVPKTNY